MVNKLDELLLFHAEALNLRAQRQQVLASNIANADTPDYKARDFDFNTALRAAINAASTNTSSKAPAPELLYRTVVQPSADGNTVDLDVERAQFAHNAARYEASLTFLNSKIKGLLDAIKG